LLGFNRDILCPPELFYNQLAERLKVTNLGIERFFVSIIYYKLIGEKLRGTNCGRGGTTLLGLAGPIAALQNTKKSSSGS